MPVVEAAWLAGDIGEAQVAASWPGPAPSATAECFARDEEMLVDQAKDLPYRHFRGRWPTGASTPIPTGSRTRPRPGTGPGGCTCRAASTGPGSSTACSTPSRATIVTRP